MFEDHHIKYKLINEKKNLRRYEKLLKKIQQVSLFSQEKAAYRIK